MAAGDSKSREKIYNKLERLNSSTDNVTAAVVATASMPNTTDSIEVFDSDGVSIGFVAVYANATLT